MTADTDLWNRLTKREKRKCCLIAVVAMIGVWVCIVLAGVLGQ